MLPLRSLGLFRRASALGCAGQLRRCSGSLEYASSCYLPTSWLDLPLVAKREHNHDSTLYSFGLPEGQALNLPTCACLLLRVPGTPDDAVRPYTPISEEARLGSFDLLVKRYPEGAASQYLHELAVGDTVGFKHVAPNVKRQHPFGVRTISMLCAGSGLTPMVQALRKLVGDPSDTTEVVLMVGNKSVEDILMKGELDELVRTAKGRLRVVHVIGTAADSIAPDGWSSDTTYTAEAGWIDRAKVEEYCYPPSPETLVFVCGLPAMYEELCGPRTEAGLAEGSLLHRLGYQADMCVKM